MSDKVAIVGSRKFKDLEAVRRFVRSLAPGTQVISGGAYGVDQVAEQEARARGLDVDVRRPDYARWGRHRAPLERNRIMVEAADRVVAFWNGYSGGTANAIMRAHTLGKRVVIFGDRP